MFHGDRLRVARLFWGLTLDEVGREVRVTRQFVQQLEHDQRQPSNELAAALASLLEVDERFFERYLPGLEEAACSFRSRRTTLKSTKARVVAHGRLLLDLIAFLESRVSFPKFTVPQIDPPSPEAIEAIAQQCRVELGVGRAAPIDSVTRAVERAGVVIADFVDISAKVDALSIRAERPIIVHSTDKLSPSRGRFDLAHELGHLAMHRVGPTGIREEAEADRFAGFFLFPAKQLRQEYPRGRINWPSLFSLKLRWGVSVAAMVRQAYGAGLIDAIQYRSANVHIRRRGWHRGEPSEVATEEPEALALAFDAIGDGGIGPAHVAEALGVSVKLLNKVTGLTLVPPTTKKIIQLRPATIDERSPSH